MECFSARVLGFKEIDKAEQFEYAAYIIHAYKDRDCLEALSPMEEEDHTQILSGRKGL